VAFLVAIAVAGYGRILGESALIISAVALAINSDPARPLDREDFLSTLLGQVSPGSPFREKLEAVAELLQKEKKPPVEEVLDRLGNDSRALCSVPPAIYSFLSHSEDFEEALVFSVGLGGDTDTIGAMTGAIAGAYRGKGSIPLRWLHALERGRKGADYIEELAIELLKIHNKIISGR